MLQMTIASTVDLVNVVRATVHHAVKATGALSGRRLEDIRLATSEAVTNAIQANHARDPSQPVEIACELRDGLVRLAVTDYGYGIEHADTLPNISDPERLHTEGGFGLPLLHTLTGDRVEFALNDPGTTVTIWMAQQ